jgi:hypothetical protein
MQAKRELVAAAKERKAAEAAGTIGAGEEVHA